MESQDVKTDLENISQRLAAVTNSCDRIRTFETTTSWSGLLSDFSAFSANLRLAINSIPLRFGSRCVVPNELPLDAAFYANVPNFLATCPPQDVIRASKGLNTRLSGSRTDKDAVWQSIKPDVDEFVRAAKSRNKTLEELALKVFADAENKRVMRNTVQQQHITPSGKHITTPYQITQELEKLHQDFSQLYNGTGREFF